MKRAPVMVAPQPSITRSMAASPPHTQKSTVTVVGSRNTKFTEPDEEIPIASMIVYGHGDIIAHTGREVVEPPVIQSKRKTHQSAKWDDEEIKAVLSDPKPRSDASTHTGSNPSSAIPRRSIYSEHTDIFNAHPSAQVKDDGSAVSSSHGFAQHDTRSDDCLARDRGEGARAALSWDRSDSTRSTASSTPSRPETSPSHGKARQESLRHQKGHISQTGLWNPLPAGSTNPLDSGESSRSLVAHPDCPARHSVMGSLIWGGLPIQKKK
jgi:hypothetical protein